MTDVGEPTRGTAMSYHSYMIPHRDHGRQLRGGGPTRGTTLSCHHNKIP